MSRYPPAGAPGTARSKTLFYAPETTVHCAADCDQIHEPGDYTDSHPLEDEAQREVAVMLRLPVHGGRVRCGPCEWRTVLELVAWGRPEPVVSIPAPRQAADRVA